jgi:hypothetical protein
MKNLIFILLFLLGFLSNNTTSAMANKAAYSTEQTIHNISKHKKLSYLEKVFTKKVEKIAKSNSKFSEIMLDILLIIGIASMFGLVISIAFLLIGLALIPFGGLGISLWWLLGSSVFFGGILLLLVALGIIRGH